MTNWNFTSLMFTLLMATFVMSSLASKPRGLPHKNHVDDSIGDFFGDDFGILAKLGKVKNFEITIEKTSHSRFSISRTSNTQNGSSSKPQVTIPRKPQISGCGRTDSVHRSRIVGGQKVNLKGKFPWMVALLQEKSKGIWGPFCGGVLISSRHILTASHCVEDEKPSNLMVRLGESNMNSSHASPSRRDVALSAIFMHEDYNPDTQLNDIAILQLKVELANWTRMIRPICLPFEPLNYEGENATVAGWGDKLEGSKNGSQYLMEVDLPIIEMNQCNESYSKGELIRPIVKEQICAGYPNGGKDSCSGDSGGPLMFRKSSKEPWTAIGIISYGLGCARKEKPGVYVRVESYYDWIQSKITIK